METLFICTREELEAELEALIAECEQLAPPRKPTWQEIWSRLMSKARSVTLNLWQCVVNRRWTSSSQIGSETAEDLVDLLLGDLSECENTALVFSLPPEGA